jgi:hypothetical protein
MLQEATTNRVILEPLEDLIASEPWSIENYADGLMNELFADIDQILDGRSDLPAKILQRGNHTAGATISQIGESFDSLYQLGNPSAHSQSQPRAQMLTDNLATLESSSLKALPLEYGSLQAATVSQIVVPQKVIHPVQSVPQVKNQQLSKFLIDTSNVSKVSKPRQKWRSILVKLLSLGIPLGLIISAVIWSLHSGVLNRLNTKFFQQALWQSPQQLPTTAKVEADLVNYLLESLAAIDRQETNNHKSAKTLLATVSPANHTAYAYVSDRPTGNLSSLNSSNASPTPSHSTTVVERLYIPIYPAPSPMRYSPPPVVGPLKALPQWAVAPKKVTPLPTSPLKTALNAVPKSAKPVTVPAPATVRPTIKPLAVRTKPVIVGNSPKPLATTPVVPFQAELPKRPIVSDPSSTGQEVVAIVSPSSVPTPSHILEGLLELGNKSAALFKIDGITRRVNVGESIGSSGWTLVDVSKGEAVIRRNGEVRSVYTGQQF